MKGRNLLMLTIVVIAIVSCGNNTAENRIADNKKLSSDTVACIQNYDVSLKKYASDFTAKEITLDKNLSADLSEFLQKVDTACLRKQLQYKPFIAIILAKQYLHHLQCCNQGYDLLGMKKGGAAVVVSEFERLAGYQNKPLEMLNSGTIVEYLEKDNQLNSEPTIKSLLEKIRKEQKRIEKGTF